MCLLSGYTRFMVEELFTIGGDKTGNDRWYDTFFPLADQIYSLHLKQL
jgi:hypothetical protein